MRVVQGTGQTLDSERPVAIGSIGRPVVIAGGSGLIGQAIARRVRDSGGEVVILSRSQEQLIGTVATWSPPEVGAWARYLDGAEAVINLSGASIGQRWTKRSRTKILQSRIESTRAIGLALQEANVRPKIWINASASGFYGDRGDEFLTENSGPGKGFLSEVCQCWEKEFFGFGYQDVRQVAIRTGMVLAANGGALPGLKALAHSFLGGGAIGSPIWTPWIHLDDLVNLYLESWGLGLSGPVNGCAPEFRTQSEVMKVIRRSEGLPFGLGVPVAFLKLMEAAVGLPAELIADSQRMSCEMALEAGFSFQWPALVMAIDDLKRGK